MTHPGDTKHFVENNTPEIVTRQMLRDQERIKELEEVYGDFCKCSSLATRLDSMYPEFPGSFTGTVSERLVRSSQALVDDLEKAKAEITHLRDGMKQLRNFTSLNPEQINTIDDFLGAK